MRLLSRNAESLFWLARYLERGASLSRVIGMQASFGGQDTEANWHWLLTLHSDEERFKAEHELTADEIVAFYVTDVSNMGSIRASVHWARENARALRPFIPLEMWVQLNAFYGQIEKLGEADLVRSQLPRTCADIRAGCLAQIGTAESTLYRDEGYRFFKLGLMIERADQTSRLLDVKFAQGARATSGDPADDYVFWSTILRAAAAYQVFNRLELKVAEPERVARFLLLNPGHPRSIGFCIQEIENQLQILRGAFHLNRANQGLEACEVLLEGLQAAGNDPALVHRLHEVNDWVQCSLRDLTETIGRGFFGAAPPQPQLNSEPAETAAVIPAAESSQKQEQHQS